MRPTVRFLSEQLVQQIIAEARSVLCQLGVEIHNPGILTLLGDHGARVDPAKNRVVVGPDRDLFRSRFRVRDLNWIRPLGAGDAVEADVKIRHNHPGAAAQVESHGASEAFVTFHQPQRAITPGQAAVFYDGDEVVGGGWIV